MPQPQITGVIRFGVFELEPQTGILRKHGVRVRLQEQPFRVLLALLEKHGEVVTREELRENGWPGTTFGDIDHSLNIAVNKIREALGDSADTPRYLETLPRRGYRFIAPVEGVAASTGEPVTSQPGDRLVTEQDQRNALGAVRNAGFNPSQRIWMAMGALLAVILIGGTGWYLWQSRAADRTSNATLQAVPLTSYPGLQRTPGFSPDGRQIVFSWNGEKRDNFDIYVKVIGSPTALRLTTSPADDVSPSFSPDGRRIGFMRLAGGHVSFITMPALGGPESVIADDLPHSRPFYGYERLFDWLPDGKWVVITGLYLLSVDSGAARKLTTPAESSVPDYAPAASPDGHAIAFCRDAAWGVADVWTLELTGDRKPRTEPRRLTNLNLPIYGVAWAPDGRELLFSGGPAIGNRSLLWSLPLSASRLPQQLRLGEHASWPTLARSGNRLAFVREQEGNNIYRLVLVGSGAHRAELFLSSTREEFAPQYSPDGKRIVFGSDRGGDYGIWVSDADGSNTVELLSRPGTHAGTPRWSPDGKRIAFDWNVDGNMDVYVIRSTGGKPIRLTSHPADDVIPSWSRDGNQIYFSSNRSGRNEVWKVPAGGGEAVQVTRNGGFVAFESADGGWLYYTKANDESTALWRTRVAGGDEEQVLPVVGFRNFFVVDKGVYFLTPRSTEGEFSIRLLDAATGKVDTLATIAGHPSNGLSVSPDGRSFLFAQLDSFNSDLMLVENFH